MKKKNVIFSDCVTERIEKNNSSNKYVAKGRINDYYVKYLFGADFEYKTKDQVVWKGVDFIVDWVGEKAASAFKNPGFIYDIKISTNIQSGIKNPFDAEKTIEWQEKIDNINIKKKKEQKAKQKAVETKMNKEKRLADEIARKEKAVLAAKRKADKELKLLKQKQYEELCSNSIGSLEL